MLTEAYIEALLVDDDLAIRSGGYAIGERMIMSWRSSHGP